MISNKQSKKVATVAAKSAARIAMLVSFSALASLGLLLALRLLRASAY